MACASVGGPVAGAPVASGAGLMGGAWAVSADTNGGSAVACSAGPMSTPLGTTTGPSLTIFTPDCSVISGAPTGVAVSLTGSEGCVKVERRDAAHSMNWFKDSRRAFVASTLGNVAVLLLSAGALSEPFIKFSAAIKSSIFIIGIVLFALSVGICPNKDEREEK